MQIYSVKDQIINANLLPLFVHTLVTRTPSLEELTLVYSIHVRPNQDVPRRASQSTQQWQQLDEYLSDDLCTPRLRSAGVQVVFGHRSYADDREVGYQEPFPEDSEDEKEEMMMQLKRGVEQRLRTS